MTATEVDGVAVISDEPTVALIKAKDGSPILWRQTRTLTLADGTVMYGCQHCDYTSTKASAVRPHLGSHKPRKTAQRTTNGHAAADLSLNELIRKVSDLDAVTADRDEWRRRALAAEKNLRTMRKALGVEVNGRG